MTTLEREIWDDSRERGLLYTGIGVGLGGLAGVLVRSTTVATAIALGAGSLRSVALEIGSYLEAGEIEDARNKLPWLVGRDPSGLDESGIAAAVIESVAENTVDAVVAPLFWALVGGAPGVLAYRAINTMDAMVGHHSERFENFGWASARLDDIANFVPARVFGAATRIVRRDRAEEISRAVSLDAPAHPSPNAGLAEAAVAGALGIELGGTLRYGDRIEHRPLLGRGDRPQAKSIGEAVDVVDDAAWFALGITGLAIGLASYVTERR